jgi:intein/homing endonuclease
MSVAGFLSGTLVLAREGYKPIEDIVVGDEVLTHLGRWRRVTTVSSRRSIPLRRVRAQGVKVTTTDEHQFWTRMMTIKHPRHTSVRSFGDPRWVAASELTRNHFLAQILPDVKPDGRAVEFWWFVGRYLADGWRVRRKNGKPGIGWTVICCAHAEADELHRRIAAAGFHATRQMGRTVVNFKIWANSLYRFLEPFGHLAHGKNLPGFALSLSREKSAALLDGYMSGDGHARRGCRTATTVSKKLAFSMALLAQRAGVVASICRYVPSKTAVIEGRLVRQRPKWSVTVPRRNQSGLVEGRYGWKKVKKSVWRGRGTVRDLSVEGDESYMADGAVVHNCRGCCPPVRATGARAVGGTE